MKEILSIIIIILFGLQINATEYSDTIVLKEVILQSSRISINEKQSLQSIELIKPSKIEFAEDNDITSSLKTGGSIDIRQRSFSSVQSDLTIRGGSFDQNLVLINGINLSDPQTGHHNLNLPINNSDLETIEIVYGPSAKTFGANALTGAVNFITKIPQKNFITIDVATGSFNTYTGNLALGYKTKKATHYFSTNYSQSDGFEYNTDFSRLSLYYENNINLGLLKLKTMGGFIDKNFGSLNFYTPAFADQFEQITSQFGAVKLSGGNNIKISANAYFRNFRDRFELFREHEDFYTKKDFGWINTNKQDTITWYQGHNHHKTNIIGSGINLEKDWFAGKSAVGTDYRHENILSNVLGNIKEDLNSDLYSKQDTRNNLSFFAEHGYYSKKILLNIGSMLYWNQKYKWNYYYGANLGYYLNSNLLLKAGINKALRLPSFTDLYYQGPSNIGNPNLTPEHAITYEIGSKYHKEFFESNINVFYRQGTDIIAWVKEFGEDMWKTENLTSLNTLGVESSISFSGFNEESVLKNIGMSYTFLDQTKNASEFESKYSLEHLRHKFICTIQHDFFDNLSGMFNITIFKRNGVYEYYDSELKQYSGIEQYKTIALLNYSIKYKIKNIELYLKAYNITNQNYFDIGNVPTPGFSILGGIKCNIL